MNLLLLTVLGAGAIALCAGSAGFSDADNDVANLIKRTEEANVALVQGNIDSYIALTRHAKDYLLMTPFGGTPILGFDNSSEHRAAMAKFFRSGTLKQEVVATYQSGDLVVLVTIERIRAVIQELPEQDWVLRVTQVYRRDGSDWQLVHRHADPLGNKISLEQAAAIARQ
jgi:ketosteroid isomerase-like protein